MSWVTDWTGSLWSVAVDTLKAPFRGVLEAWAGFLKEALPPGALESIEAQAHKAGYSASPVNFLLALPCWFLSLHGFAQAATEPETQRIRLSVLNGAKIYPPDPTQLAAFGQRDGHYLTYWQNLLNRLGFKDEAYLALKEMARRPPDVDMLRALYNRGLVDYPYVEACLGELGFADYIDDWVGTPDTDTYQANPVWRGDKGLVQKLFSLWPDIGSLIAFEIRDTFPIDPDIYPAEERTEAWQKWKADTLAHRPLAYDWEPGKKEPLIDALKESTTYGPQSFESWFQGARERYTKTFEKSAGAGGLDPYWAMKYWESHWKLPDFSILRELLFRSPMFDEQRVSDVLRWQDYPPAFLKELVRIMYQPLTRIDTRRMHERGVIGVPRVFKSYLAQGYNTEDAMRMTAFTAVYNAQANYGGLMKEVLKSYGEGALEDDEAFGQLWMFMAEEIPEQLPEWVNSELTPAQIQAVRDTYTEIKDQLSNWITQQLTIAAAEAQVENLRSFLETAKKQYVGWDWTPTQTQEYLSRHGFSSDRIQSLMYFWAPLRDRNERLPTQSMLETFLLEQDMSVDTWRMYMSKLGYSDTIIMQILQGVGKLPTVAMLQAMLKAKTIDPETFITNMLRLGYDRWTAEHMVATILTPET